MKKVCSVIMTFVLLVCISVAGTGVLSSAAVRDTDVSDAAAGNAIVGVKGKYESIKATKILDRVNEIRKEACKKGYRNPVTGEKLTMDDYVEIKWSSTLEWIASIRAAESTVLGAHVRPNGESCFTVTKDGEQSWGEVLAWNYDGMMQGIEQWYGEKNDWVNQNTDAVTGHYTAMISPNSRYIGVAAFASADGGWIGVAGEFSSRNPGTEKKLKLKENVIQKVEVTKASFSGGRILGAASLTQGDQKAYRLVKKVVYSNGVHGENHTTTGMILDGIKWKSSNTKIVSVDDNGKVTAKKPGKATITAVCGKKVFTKTIEVK